MSEVTNEELMMFLDGELDPDDHARVSAALSANTELARELAIYRGIQEDISDLSFSPRPLDTSVWGTVNRQITRPVGWILFTGGALIFAVYTAIVFATSSANTVEKIGVGGLVVGFLVLLAATVFERMKEWRTDPYRDIQR